MVGITGRRQWRKEVKKLQRKRRRQILARERDKRLEEDNLEKLKDPSYRHWLENQERLEEEQRLAAEKEHEENEEQWLRRELLAQKQFQREQQQRLAEEKAKEQLREEQYRQQKEREEVLRRKKEAMENAAEQAAKELEERVKLCQKYLDEPGLETPIKLRGFIETRPNEKECEFYNKTHCCRYGFRCGYNHKTIILSKIIVIRNFFEHRLLDQQIHREYKSAEEQLEVSEEDLIQDYHEFCEDVWPELEQFGEIVNIRTVRNRLPHIRGHVFVEYVDKRSALKAFINLQNRFYASKQLRVEFCHISHWRTGICGYYLARKCPKGEYCNYLHLIPNPGNKYNTPLEPMGSSQRSLNNPKRQQETPSLSWNSATPNKRGNWRWSESPEKEICANTSHKLTNEEGASKQTDLIVLLSSSEDEEKETSGNNRKGCSSDLKNIKKATQSKRQRKPNRSKADTISIVPSSSNTYFEEDGEIRTRLEDTPRRSRSPRREEKSYRTHKEDSSYRYKHKKRRSPEGRRHKSSPRSSSSHSKGTHSPHSRRSCKSSRKDR